MLRITPTSVSDFGLPVIARCVIEDEIAEDGFVTVKWVRKKLDRFEQGRNRDMVMSAELALQGGGSDRPPHVAMSFPARRQCLKTAASIA